MNASAAAPDSGASWRVLAASGVIVALGVPVIFGTTLGLFLLPMQAELGWSRADIAFALTLMTFLAPAIALPTGWLIDRIPLRPCVLAGVLLQALNIAAFSLVGADVWSYYLLCIGLMFTGAGASVAVMSKFILGWFDKKLGRAMGILFACGGVGGIFMPMIVQGLMASVGWRQSYAWLGGGSFVVSIVVALWVLHEHPRAAALRAQRMAATRSAREVPAGTAVTLRGLLKLRTWWVLALWNTLFAFAVGGIFFHYAAMLQDRGAAPAQAALALSLMAGGRLVGDLSAGWLMDHLPPRRMATGLMLMPLLPLSVLLLTHNIPLALLAGFLFGLCSGADGSFSAYLAQRYFGTAMYGQAYMSQGVVASFGGGLAPWFAGLIFESTGSYQWALLTAGAGFLLAALSAVMLPVRTPAEPMPAEPAPT